MVYATRRRAWDCRLFYQTLLRLAGLITPWSCEPLFSPMLQMHDSGVSDQFVLPLHDPKLRFRGPYILVSYDLKSVG